MYKTFEELHSFLAWVYMNTSQLAFSTRVSSTRPGKRDHRQYNSVRFRIFVLKKHSLGFTAILQVGSMNHDLFGSTIAWRIPLGSLRSIGLQRHPVIGLGSGTSSSAEPMSIRRPSPRPRQFFSRSSLAFPLSSFLGDFILALALWHCLGTCAWCGRSIPISSFSLLGWWEVNLSTTAGMCMINLWSQVKQHPYNTFSNRSYLFLAETNFKNNKLSLKINTWTYFTGCAKCM